MTSMTQAKAVESNGAKDAPILIFGALRSGTSLLSRLLDAHSRISIPFESHLFNQWANRAEAYGDLDQKENKIRLIRDIIRFGVVRDWTPRPNAEEVTDHLPGPGFASVARTFMTCAAHSAGKPRWGEKTPHHTLVQDLVFEAWPEAVVVMIYRDPRDVALSWKNARFGGNHVVPFAQSWSKYVEACEAVRERLPLNSWCEVYYENLVSDTEQELTRLMSFLGEEFQPNQLQFHSRGGSWKTDQRNEMQLRKPVSKDSVWRWKTGLSKREVRLVEAMTGPIMERHGYVRAFPQARLI